MRRKLLLFLPIALIYLFGFFLFDRWGNLYTRGDDVGYYLHVVAFWINRDTGDYSESLADLVEAHPEARFVEEDPFLIRPTDRGRRYIKYTLGVGLMETPFFLLAHAYASVSDAYRANGWDRPYYLMIGLGNVFFILLGIWLLLRLLEPYFTWPVVALATWSVALATNLFFQAVYFTMAHGFLFFHYCLLLWLTERFYRRPTLGKALWLGLSVGFITLIRVPEVISALIPLLWGVWGWDSLRRRFRAIRQHPKYVAIAGMGFLMVFGLQLAYWQLVSGHLLFNPYQGEGFNFLQPMIWKGWLDFSNGWLIYTPIMCLALAGLIWLRRYHPAMLLPLLSFVGLHVYIHYSYYAWKYYPGLGSRPMVETYPLLAFGLAACFQVLAKQKNGVLRWVPWLAVAFFTWLNLFQTWQSNQGLIWSERHNGAFYLESFGRVKGTHEALVAFESAVLQPDATQLKRRALLAREDFEDLAGEPAPGLPSFEGEGVYELEEDEAYLPLAVGVALHDVDEPTWLRTSLWAYMPPEDHLYDRDRCAELVIEIRDEKGQTRLSKSIKISTHIGNPTYSIWTTGAAGAWGRASFFVRIPRRARPTWTAQAFVRNKFGQRLFLDAFRLETYTCR